MVFSPVELSEYNIWYVVKGKLSSLIQEVLPSEWELSMDSAYNIKGSIVRIVLEGSGDLVIEQALKFWFTTRNNQAEYEALIVGMILSLEMDATRLKVKVDSHLVTNHVSGQYKAK